MVDIVRGVKRCQRGALRWPAICVRFMDGDVLARRLETDVAPRLTPRMFMHKIQRACSAQVRKTC